jgi:O-antigen/teichoic acid export membrane protein
MQKKVFANSLLLHIAIGCILVVGLEIIGLFLFNGYLNIPVDRLNSARIIYHFMSATFFFTVIAVPFTGLLVAHENMFWVAVVNVIETVLKLGIALLLIILQQDKLVTFGLLTAGISIVSFILYAVFCFKRYKECTVKNIFIVERTLMKELTSFAGWNLFGSLCGLSRTQGLAVLLNLFFGTVINAAYGIANQVAAQLSFFSATLLRAINPQIMKSEGTGDRQRMLRISMMASKFGFFLLAIVAIPCIFEMKEILKMWLKNVPQNTTIFCNLILIGTMINQLTIGLQSAIQATGRIKMYQAVVGSIILLNIPVAYILLRIGMAAYVVLVTFSIIEFIACIFRLYFLNRLAGLSIREYIKKVFLKEILPVLITVLCCYIITLNINNNYRFIITGLISFSVFAISIYFFGLEANEKKLFETLLTKIKNRLRDSKEMQVVE